MRGFNESLPWPDDSFNTVISASALDHVLSLDVALDEVVRVLAPRGVYLVWIASVPGSPAFVLGEEPPVPIDAFHLFHFERGWIEPLFEKRFRIIDATVITQPGYDHIFYCMTPS